MTKFAVGASIFVALTLAGASVAAAKTWNDWGTPVNAETLPGSSSLLNSAYNDGCPNISPYDGSLYFASTRPGGYGKQDIWIAPPSGDGWGAPVNAGPTINTAEDEFCPSPARGNRFFFVRRLTQTNTDIFVVKKLPKGWGTPTPLPRGADAINSPWEEWSPSVYDAGDGQEGLYFSSTRAELHRAHDIYYSIDLGPAQIATGGANSSASDARPNVSHDGLELVWDSTRYGSLGLTDIWSARRSSVNVDWDAAVQLGNGINSAGVESRPTMSWDGTRLVFGTSLRPGGEGFLDIWMSTRTKVTGSTR